MNINAEQLSCRHILPCVRVFVLSAKSDFRFHIILKMIAYSDNDNYVLQAISVVQESI